MDGTLADGEFASGILAPPGVAQSLAEEKAGHLLARGELDGALEMRDGISGPALTKPNLAETGVTAPFARRQLNQSLEAGVSRIELTDSEQNISEPIVTLRKLRELPDQSVVLRAGSGKVAQLL